jgi:hypothetical protein
MATFDTNVKIESITDHVTGKKVKAIIEKYLSEPINEELSDNIMKDIIAEFGEDHPAQINLDDETNDIEIIVRDLNGRYIKCSSLTLFPSADK